MIKHALFLLLFSILPSGILYAEEPKPVPVTIMPVPVQPVRNLLQISDFATQQCDDNKRLCFTVYNCPTADELFLPTIYRFNSLCLKVTGKVMEMYAPTPASDAVRSIDADIANLQIPLKWLREKNLSQKIPVNFDSYYFTNQHDQIVGTLYVGEGGITHLWSAIVGPFQHFQSRQGLGDATIVHTRISKSQNNQDYQYTLFSSLGDPIIKSLPAKEAYFITDDAKALLDKYDMIDGYTSLNLFDVICYSDAPRTMTNPNDYPYQGCKSVFHFSPYVTLQADITFVDPLPRLDAMKWFNQLGEYIRPLFIEGRSASVRPLKSNMDCKGFICW